MQTFITDGTIVLSFFATAMGIRAFSAGNEGKGVLWLILLSLLFIHLKM